MRDSLHLPSPAPQAPARNTSPSHPPPPPPAHPPSPSLDTYNSHRKPKRPRLGCRHVYRPSRRRTLSRIEESSPRMRPRSKSLHHSTDFSSTAPFARSRSNISADTSRSVPVCNQSHELTRRDSSASPQYAEPTHSDSSSGRRHTRVSMSDAPLYPEHTYYREACLVQANQKVKKSKHNLYLAFMY